jgi:hypothetical protein
MRAQGQFSADTDFPIYLLKQFIETQASREEYTRQLPQKHQGRILEFPFNRDSDGDGETGVQEG